MKEDKAKKEELIYQEENLDKSNEQFTAKPVSDEKVEGATDKINPDANTLDRG